VDELTPNKYFPPRKSVAYHFPASHFIPAFQACGTILPFRIGYPLGRQGEAEPVPVAGKRRKFP
jgi:hypothetical protein